MKNWIYIFMMGLVVSLVSSCQQSLDEDVQVSATIGKAKVSFTIALDDVASRAMWSENDSPETGSTFDNEISRDGLLVKVYYTYGEAQSATANLNIKNFFKVVGTDNTYQVEGELTITNVLSVLIARLEVYANCIGGYETFSIGATRIPMWGVKSFTQWTPLAQGEGIKLTEPIYLLRAMAKVEVLVADGVGKLESVMVDKYNEKGNVLPIGAAGATATEAMDDQAVFNPNTTTLGTDLEFLSDGNGGFYIYLPEYQNVGAASPAQMGVVIDGETYPLEFKKYSDGTLFNIVRNHYFQYIITGVVTQEDAEMALNYDVIIGTPQEVIVPSFE